MLFSTIRLYHSGWSHYLSEAHDLNLKVPQAPAISLLDQPVHVQLAALHDPLYLMPAPLEAALHAPDSL